MQVWDHIFLGKPVPADCQVPAEKLELMRREFEYWYPWDLRVSGKVRPPSILDLPFLWSLKPHTQSLRVQARCPYMSVTLSTCCHA